MSMGVVPPAPNADASDIVITNVFWLANVSWVVKAPFPDLASTAEFGMLKFLGAPKS